MIAPKSDCTLYADLERILIEQEAIDTKVAELGAQISADYAGKSLVLVSVLKGGVIFLADLIRQITLPLQIELVGASSYKGGTAPTPGVRITKDVDQNLADKHVLLVEDIYDTGHTLKVVHDLLAIHCPASLDVCALLSKRKNRSRQLDLKYVGFEIDDEYVVGYGLDFKEMYRNLPCIGVLKPDLYE